MKVFGVVLVVAALGLVGCTAEQPQASPPGSVTATTAASTTAVSTVVPTSPSSSVPVDVPVAAPSTVTSTVVETVVVDPTPVLSHTGFGAIELGMTEEQLLATGLVARHPEDAAGGSCEAYKGKDGDRTVWVQGAEGVVAIMVRDAARTPEEVPLDLHPDDPALATAYPNGYRAYNEFRAPLHDDVVYWFTGGGAILTRQIQLCFG